MIGSSTANSVSWDHHSHPLHLQANDQPGAVLVQQPLTEHNYQTWARSMREALLCKTKVGFIDGTLKKPTEESPEQTQWEKCNVLVKSWLTASMTDEIKASVVSLTEARAIWLELKE
ncbi:hypothetical protein ACLB2K_077482 [Fragaria x ananassa]